MKTNRARAYVVVGAMLLGLTSSCAINPITNKPIASSFAGCMAFNTGLGALGGLLVAKATDSKKAGWATAGVTVLIAWNQCAKAYQKVENVAVKSREEMQLEGPTPAKLVRIDQLKLTVGAPGEDLNSVVRYTVLADDPARKDIPVKEYRVIRVPKTVQDQTGHLFFADAQGRPLSDSKGRPIPVNGKAPHDTDALVYDDVAVPAEIVVKQGMRKADGLLQSPSELPVNLPYRMKFVVEAEGLRAEKELDFTFRKPGTGVATYEAKIYPVESKSSASSESFAPVPSRESSFSQRAENPNLLIGQSGKCARRVALLHLPGGSKKLGQVPAGSQLTILETETMQSGAKGLKGQEWLKVRTQTGQTGWMRKADFRGSK